MTTTTQSWQPSYLVCDGPVGRAIELWHVEAGIACPADSEFGSSKWEIPAGTTDSQMEHQFNGVPLAERLRVTLSTGRVYVLDIQWDGICGCGECSAEPLFIVRDEEVVRQ